MNNFRVRAVAVALATTVTLGCEDVPLLPTWDADWYVPVASQGIDLLGPFAASVPAGTSANVSFAAQQQSLDGAIGGILEQEVRSAQVILTVTKTLAVSADDTLFIAGSAADLTNAAAVRILVPVALTAADVSVTDTVPVDPAGLALLQTTAQNGGSIFVQLRGQATWAGPGSLTVTANDSIGVRLALLARIAVSR